MPLLRHVSHPLLEYTKYRQKTNKFEQSVELPPQGTVILKHYTTVHSQGGDAVQPNQAKKVTQVWLNVNCS